MSKQSVEFMQKPKKLYKSLKLFLIMQVISILFDLAAKAVPWILEMVSSSVQVKMFFIPFFNILDLTVNLLQLLTLMFIFLGFVITLENPELVEYIQENPDSMIVRFTPIVSIVKMYKDYLVNALDVKAKNLLHLDSEIRSVVFNRLLIEFGVLIIVSIVL